MLILEKSINKNLQIWITYDEEIRDTKFGCRLKGKSKLFFIRIDLARPFIGDAWLLIHISFAPPNLFNELSTPPSAFRLPHLCRRDGRWLYGEVLQGGGPAATSLLVFLSVVCHSRQESEVPRWWRGAVLACRRVCLPQRSMEEAGSLSARGRKSYTRARAKLADSSNARKGEAGFFPWHEGRSVPRVLRWA
jgi:hypothetical protein